MLSISLRNKRIIISAAVIALSFGLYLFIYLFLDHAVWEQLKEAYIDWKKSIPLFENLNKKESSDTLVTLLSVCPGVLLLSFAGLWAGYSAKVPKFIVLMILIALSVIYQFLVWVLMGVQSPPLSFAMALIASIFVGAFLKKRENELKDIETANTEIELRNRNVQELGLEMVKQDEEGRRLLAADLHDQVLNDMRVTLDNFEQYTKEQDEELKKQIVDQMKTSMTDIREIMDDLCPVVLSEFGLCAAIEDRLDKASKQFKLKVRFNSSVDDSELEKFSLIEQQLIYRLVQESITNLCKHAKATQVKITISKQGELITFRTTDDGIGIDLSKMSDTSRGTMYMRLKASLINATVAWEIPESGKGTDFVLSVPIAISNPVAD